MNLVMARWMEQHPVTGSVTAPVRTPDHMVVLPPGEIGDRLGTNGAQTLLLMPQVQQRPLSVQGAAA